MNATIEPRRTYGTAATFTSHCHQIYNVENDFSTFIYMIYRRAPKVLTSPTLRKFYLQSLQIFQIVQIYNYCTKCDI